MSAICLIGATGSVALVLWVGRGNPSVLLMALFVAWVSVPFAVLLAAARLMRTGRGMIQKALTVCATVVSAVSLSAYGAVAVLHPRQPAAAFLVVPLASLVLMAIVLSIAARRRRQP